MSVAITCVPAHANRTHYAHGWCKSCYVRWDRAGRPADGPPPLLDPTAQRHARITNIAKANTANQRRFVERREEYDWLRYADEIPEQAAARVGVGVRTAFRYEAARKEVAA